jgi:hypothetical protein
MLLRLERARKRLGNGTTIGACQDSDVVATIVKTSVCSIYTYVKRT